MFSLVAAKRRQQLFLFFAVAYFSASALLANTVAFARKAEYYYNSVTGEVRFSRAFDRHFSPGKLTLMTAHSAVVCYRSRLIFSLCFSLSDDETLLLFFLFCYSMNNENTNVTGDVDGPENCPVD